MVQDAWEVGNDAALAANGRVVDIVDAEGTGRRIVVNPVDFDGHPVRTQRAPHPAEHTDEVLAESGVDRDQIQRLRAAGVLS